MAQATLKDVLDPAFDHRYGVAAINVVDDLSLRATIAAAEHLQAPLIVQTSLKTVKSIGAEVLFELYRRRAEEVAVPVALHLDHCPEREWVSVCLEAGWGSVLFDGSHLTVEQNTAETAAVVEEAERFGAFVEGEIETVAGVEDGVGSEMAGEVHPSQVSSEFIAATGVYCFAPAIGTAHGMYATEPRLMPERVDEIVARRPIPMVLHGGTGLAEDQFRDLISRGCAKVNISTALKFAYIDAARDFLTANPDKHDPPSLLAAVGAAVRGMAEGHIGIFGSAGKAPIGN
ncbi:MAG TPA: class II fructose-bisphosphate aldolase [Solirubrobacterales bacterium]|nr:class II fructose-bisphosphate aldolase [Solirubrobacterales bacterium]